MMKVVKCWNLPYFNLNIQDGFKKSTTMVILKTEMGIQIMINLFREFKELCIRNTLYPQSNSKFSIRT